MPLEELIRDYGYFAVVIGTILEGESVLIAAAVLVAGGYLSRPWVIVAAVIGGVCGDQFFFLAGRRYGVRILSRSRSLERKAEKALGLLRGHQTLVMLCFRFVYGFRAVTPLLIGAAGIKPLRFFLLDVVSVTLWSTLATLAVFQLGRLFLLVFHKITAYKFMLIVFILAMLLALSIAGLVHIRKKRLESARKTLEKDSIVP